MSNFEYNNIEDLVFSPSFRQWVLSQDTGGSLFWSQYINEHPEKKELINHAKAIIYALQVSIKDLSEKEINYEIKKVLQKIQSKDYADDDTIAPVVEGKNIRSKILQAYSLHAAAAVIVICFVSFFIYYISSTSTPPQNIYTSFIADNTGIKKTIIGDTSHNIQLPDGSMIFLKPKSRLTYDLNFKNNKREVYLTGEAFFKIKKDPSRPFIVYTNSIVAKVLGTSFWVKAYSSDKQAVVTVKTGKVSVYRSSSFTGLVKDHLISGVVVTPNQELVYDKENNELNKTLTGQPVLLSEKVGKNMFEFKATPVGTVLKTLQNAYGITIVFDEDSLSACSLSATMGDESFYAKLNMICKAINASYEMIDGNIIIASQGCK